MHSFTAEGILFDLDGVLVDSTTCVTRVWAAWAKERGYDPDEVVRIAHGRRAIETVQLVAPHLDAAAELKEVERRELEDTEGLTVFAGAAELLSSLPPARWAVVTSATRALATKRMQVAGLTVPGHMVTADDVAQGKPDPAPYLKGAEMLGLMPGACLVLEDAPSGIRAAKRAGMRVIAVPTTYAVEELGEADQVIRSLGNLRVSVNGTGALNVGWAM